MSRPCRYRLLFQQRNIRQQRFSQTQEHRRARSAFVRSRISALGLRSRDRQRAALTKPACRVRQCLEFNGRDRADKCHPGSCSRADSRSRSANCLRGGLDREHNYRPVRCNQAGSHSMFATQDRSRSHNHKAVAADSTEHSQPRCRRQRPIQSRKPQIQSSWSCAWRSSQLVTRSLAFQRRKVP